MTETFLDTLVAALDTAMASNPAAEVAPVALLWPDESGQWAPAVSGLRQRRRVLTLGKHQPDLSVGPAFWVRSVVAGCVPVEEPHGLPIVYLPGVSRDALRAASADDGWLAPLSGLQHRSQWFAQPNGKDWTIRALLANKERGLGADVPADDATSQALVSGLAHLLNEPVQRLEGHRIDASFVNGLIHPDVVRRILQWLDDPTGVEAEMTQAAWDAFVTQLKSDYGFDLMAEGVIAGARRLGLASGAWKHVWQRFRESPLDYPNIPERLRQARPEGLFTGADLAWPQDNEAAEYQLRSALFELPALTATGARKELAEMEKAHGIRRSSVWAQLGLAPLAFAVQHLVDLASRTSTALTGYDVASVRGAYATDGWRADSAALRAIAEADSPDDLKAVYEALDAVYKPWLHEAAKVFQDVVGPLGAHGGYEASPAPTPSSGEVVVFVDGLRLDVAHRLAERLATAGVEVGIETGLAALPTVTQTAKPALVPIDPAMLGPGKDLDAGRAENGVSAGVAVLRSLMKDAGVQVLGGDEVGDPSGRAWTEAGEVDHKGHDLGPRIAHEIDAEVALISRRIRDLLAAGWSTVSVVTDHGWLLLPSGLPKTELAIALTEKRKGRCARLKAGAAAGVPTVPWHWDEQVLIAVAPGISCFEDGKKYEHGGISPQECVVPRITVTTGAALVATSSASIASYKWNHLMLVVECADLPDGAQIDLRRQPGDPSSSVATVFRATSNTDKRMLSVEDDDLEGQLVYLVIVDADGIVLLQRETTVGRNS